MTRLGHQLLAFTWLWGSLALWALIGGAVLLARDLF